MNRGVITVCMVKQINNMRRYSSGIGTGRTLRLLFGLPIAGSPMTVLIAHRMLITLK